MGARTVTAAAAALAVAAIATGGIYQYANWNVSEQTGGGTPAGAPGTAAQPGLGFSFVVPETPRSLPELSFVNGEGSKMTMEAFDGQFVLLNIWATWCGPCRREMPALDRLQAKLGGPDFRVVPLSIDREGVPAVKAFYAELGLKSLGIYVDRTGKASRQLSAVGIPTTLLVDPAGREIGRTVGPAEWDSGEVVEAIEQYVGFRGGDRARPSEGMK